MDVVASELKPSFITKTQIVATDIPVILDHYADKIKVLSLDCFDTLLWRKTATPKDIFYDLQHRPLFQSLNVTAYQRLASAARAYRAKFITHQNRQVSLYDIYHFFTALSEEQKTLLVAEELQAEIENCYAFFPFIDLIRQAKKRGIKIIIVSDIYLNEKQLRLLLSAHLPTDVMQAIDQIFCSIEYGQSKSEGLFPLVLKALSAMPEAILHIGDHLVADFESPKKLGLKALHFLQFNHSIMNFLRLQNSAAALAFLLHPAARHVRQARYSPFRGIFSLHQPLLDKPESVIGYMTFGPMLYAFARFLSDELAMLRQAGKKIKVFFLLRDAYLLSRACEAYAGKPMGQLVRIRKFVAVAASFRTQADIDYYISGILPQHYNMWVICEQLLLPHAIIVKILEIVHQSSDREATFNQLLHQAEIMQVIFKHSADARMKLKKYMLKEMQLEAGDTVVLVDTGYMGVTQDFLARALQDELSIEITSRYFIASHEPDRPLCRALMTSSWCEHGLFEQSCTYQEGAVLGYDDHGNPILDTIKLSDQQYEKVQAIQNECMRFIQDAKKFFAETQTPLPYAMLQKTAEAALNRHIFFPTPEEVHYFKMFQHDKDMGGDLKKTMYNLDHAVTALKQSHIPYQPHPYEARAIHLDLTLSALMKRAFDLEFTDQEKSYYQEVLTVVVVQGADNARAKLYATQTYDGFFSCCINTRSNFHVGIVFGEQYEWVQIDKVTLIQNPQINLLHDENKVALKKMKKNKTLFTCEARDAFLMLLPLDGNSHLVTYQIIFRPLVRWDGA